MGSIVSRRAKYEMAGIEYSGLPGITEECRDAVLRLLQYGDSITKVRILSSAHEHGLLLTVNVGDLVAVKSGFGSGYRGEGARGFSYVLTVLKSHGADIEEYEVAPEFIERLDFSALTRSDLDAINAARPVRPNRWHKYIFEEDWDPIKEGTLWREFRPVIPLAIIETWTAPFPLESFHRDLREGRPAICVVD